jgi:fermentation-respiration switch protein FrsA (DUF1100 family)
MITTGGRPVRPGRKDRALTTPDVPIDRGPVTIAGRLHLPADLDISRRHAAVVISTTGSSVKEQIGATDGERLAASYRKHLPTAP